MGGCASTFVVTADHRLLSQGVSGQTAVRACSLRKGMMLHDGQGFCVIEEANPFSKCVEVIKVHFLDDKCVLVSLLPRRRSKGAGFSSVVAYGNDQVPEVIVARTFFDEPSKFVPPRSRSADNAPSANSCWSVGTISHDENNPG